MDGVTLDGLVDKARYGLQAAAQAEPGHTTDPAKAEQAAQDFEAFFLTMVFENMFAGIKTDGYFGGGHGESIFRSLMLQEYGKSVAKAGGIGLADAVQREILRVQEVQNQ